MLYVHKLIAALLLPPGIFIAALLFISLYMYYHKQRGRCLVAAVTLAMYLLSTGWVAGMLMRPLEDIQPGKVEQAEIIVVLGGGASGRNNMLNNDGELGGFSANRLLTAAQLQRKLQIPLMITGGQVFAESGNEAHISRKVLLNLGISDSMIIVEDKARNTAENAAHALSICRELGVQKVCLVTSAFHMKRSLTNFAGQNNDGYFTFLPYPCDYQISDQSVVDIFSFVPRQDALEISYLALHEYLGILASKLL